MKEVKIFWKIATKEQTNINIANFLKRNEEIIDNNLKNEQ